MDPTEKFPLQWQRTRCTFDASLEQCSKSQVGVSGIQKWTQNMRSSFLQARNLLSTFCQDFMVVFLMVCIFLYFSSELWPEIFFPGGKPSRLPGSTLHPWSLDQLFQQIPWLWLDVGDEISLNHCKDLNFKQPGFWFVAFAQMKVGQKTEC